MPVIAVHMGKIFNEKKKELIDKLTKTAIEVTNIPASAFTVLIHELGDENIGIGGVDIATLKSTQHK